MTESNISILGYNEEAKKVEAARQAEKEVFKNYLDRVRNERDDEQISPESEQKALLAKNRDKIVSIVEDLFNSAKSLDKINKNEWVNFIEAKIDESSTFKPIERGETFAKICVGSYYEDMEGVEQTIASIGKVSAKYLQEVEKEEKAKKEQFEETITKVQDSNNEKEMVEFESKMISDFVLDKLKTDGDYIQKLLKTSDAEIKTKYFKNMTTENIQTLDSRGPLKNDWQEDKDSDDYKDTEGNVDSFGGDWKKDLTIRRNVNAMLEAGGDRFNHIFNVYLLKVPKFNFFDWGNGESTVQSLMINSMLTGDPQKIKFPNKYLSQVEGTQVSPAVLSFLTDSVTNSEETIKDDIKTVKRFGRDVHQVLNNQRKGQTNEFSISLTQNWEANIMYDIWKLEHQSDMENGILTSFLAFASEDLVKNPTAIMYPMPALFEEDSNTRTDLVVVDVSGVKRQVIGHNTILPAAWTMYRNIHFTNFGDLQFNRSGSEELKTTLRGNYVTVESGVTNLTFLS